MDLSWTLCSCASNEHCSYSTFMNDKSFDYMIATANVIKLWNIVSKDNFGIKLLTTWWQVFFAFLLVIAWSKTTSPQLSSDFLCVWFYWNNLQCFHLIPSSNSNRLFHVCNRTCLTFSSHAWPLSSITQHSLALVAFSIFWKFTMYTQWWIRNVFLKPFFFDY